MSSSDEFEKAIVERLRERGADGLRRSELRRQLGLRASADPSAFGKALRSLERKGAITKPRRGRYRLPDGSGLVPGRLVVNPRGFGFVQRDDGEPDVFVPARALGNALSGDRVLVSLAEADGERGPSGTVQRILAHGRTHVTGEFVDTDDGPLFRPMSRELPDSFPARGMDDEPALADLQSGDWVVARMERTDDRGGQTRARVIERLGSKGSIAGDLDAVVREYDLPPRHSDAEVEASRAVTLRDVERRDLGDLPVITIDPDDAKDFDDALSVQAGASDGTMVVGVHIADVAAFVAPGSALDLAARRRGFTAYLPGRTLPMLPGPLSSDACSLREGESRPAHSVFLELDLGSGTITSSWREHTRIRVSRRFTFEDVQGFLASRSPEEGWPEEVVLTLRRLADAYLALRRQRQENEAFLELAIPEVRVRCSEAPARILGLAREEHKEAHALVEEFMLAANSCVAAELEARGIPGIFRVHPEPKAQDFEDFRTWARETLNLSPGRMADRRAVNRFLGSLAGIDRGRDAVLAAFLRARPRAIYRASPDDHFGLGKGCYCHFTSPIRRYPDLLVHQQLWEADTGGTRIDSAECHDLAVSCTEMEGDVDQAYYAASDRLKLRYLAQLRDRGEEVHYEGLVARVLPREVLVFLPDLGLYGVLSCGGKGRDAITGTGNRRRLRAADGARYRCGDSIYVQVHRIDVTKGRLELRPFGAHPVR